MITIDVPADLHFEDDSGSILAQIPDSGAPVTRQAPTGLPLACNCRWSTSDRHPQTLCI